MAKINFKRMSLYLDKKTEFGSYLLNSWLNNGYQNPEEYLKSLVNAKNNPLNLLKEVRVKFRVIEAEKVLLNKDFIQNRTFNISRFTHIFNNNKLIKKSIRTESITEEVIKKGKAYAYLSTNTKREVPIPRLSNTKGIIFASIFNENENAAAIRVFLDLLITSTAGKKIIQKLGFISQEDLEELMTEGSNIKLVSNWKQGTQTNLINFNLGGIPDGLVALKRPNLYKNEFFIEYIGLRKGRDAAYSLMHSSPFSNVIADLLRVACNSASGKPGIVVHGSFNESKDVIYTIFKFNEKSIFRLKKAGANLAVDLNRPMVKEIINEANESLLKRLNDIFYDTSTIDLGEDLLKFSITPISHENLFKLYHKLCLIILGISSSVIF
jgi:hypothetical protein